MLVRVSSEKIFKPKEAEAAHMRLVSLLLSLALISGCVQSGFSQFYTPYVDAKTLSDVELLQEGEEPQVFSSDDFERDVADLLSKNYILVGQSSFNGGYEDPKNLAEQAKKIGAVLVLSSVQFTNRQTNSTVLVLPNNQTTTYSGTINSNSGTSRVNGRAVTTGSQIVPITTQQDRYDQNALYFVKSTQRYKFGLRVRDLSSEERRLLQRNAGAYIDVVMEDSPAFFANLFPGDIITSIDGQLVRGTEHAVELMGAVDESQQASTFLIIRNSKEMTVDVVFDTDAQ